MLPANRQIPFTFIKVMTILASNDLRVGQMFDNIFAEIRNDGKDPFYIENKDLEDYFWKYMSDHNIKPFE